MDTNRSSAAPHFNNFESITTRTQFVLLCLTQIFAAVTLLIIILLIAEIRSHQFKQQNGSFFTICAVGFVYNAIALVNLDVGGSFASLGLLPASYTQTNVTVQIFYFFANFARSGEVITTIFIALNRMTAIFLPVRHRQIWSSRSLFFCFFYQFLMGLVVGGMVVFTSDFSWQQAPDGVILAKLQQTESSSLVLYGILAVSVSFVSVVFLLYAFSYYQLRNNLKKSSLEDRNQVKSERSLSYMAAATCLVEAI